MGDEDTIAAIATPPGYGGICIVRVSGPAVVEISRSILGRCPKPRHAACAAFRDNHGNPVDEGLAIFFPAPASFTGEDVLELHGHGGPVVSDMILSVVLAAGARLARPGEFSRRAFLNNKLDLAQAEAVADLISAGSRRAASAALRTLEGEFSHRINTIWEELTGLRMYVESSMDFADEDIEFLRDGEITQRLALVQEEIGLVMGAATQGRILTEGLQVTIAGLPNAGKSSLMNTLTGSPTAIVTDIPGTTRDILTENIAINGIPVQLRDTAGLRDDAEEIEREGIRRAKDSLQGADLVLWVHDDRYPLIPAQLESCENVELVPVRNKIDITGRTPGYGSEDGLEYIAISAQSGEGLDVLREHIVSSRMADTDPEHDLSARRRHMEALGRVEAHLQEAANQLEIQLESGRGGELLAEELRYAQQCLGEITGKFGSDDLLGKIFAEFCIGK